MTDTEEELASKVPEVRQKFQSQCAENISKGLYDEVDIQRLQNDDTYVERFLYHQKLNVDKAVGMVDMSLKFRKELDLNNLTEKSFPRQMHELGAMFYHGTDKDDTKILIFQVGKTKKDPEYVVTVKKFISWWIDKHFLNHMGERLVILFDMSNAGISNMDMEMIKFQISCFTTYYPGLLKCMLIYDMPWILNTLWKVIKQLLTPEQQKVVLFVKQSEIQNHIPAENLLEYMGGKDPFQYHYIPSEDSGIDIPNGHDLDPVEEEEDISENSTTNPSTRKKVTFAEKNLTLYTSFDGETVEEETTPPASPKDKLKPNHKSSKKITVKARPREDDIFVGPFAAISPSDHFIFNPVEGAKELADVLTIANISDQQIAFKVKTTSPDWYRVRPSTGLIKPQNAAEINIFLQAGALESLRHDNIQVPKDRFLVMVMKVDDTVTSANQLTSAWKSATKDTATYMDHRLSCQLNMAGDQPAATASAQASELTVIKDYMAQMSSQMENLIQNQRRIQRRVSCLFIFQILVAVTFGVVITIVVILSFLDIDINPFSNKQTSVCTPWHNQ